MTHSNHDTRAINMAKSAPRFQTQRFDSITAYGTAVRALGTQRHPKAGRASEKSRHADWDNGHSFDDAVKCACAGGYWPEGAQALQSVNIHDLLNTAEFTVQSAIELAVTGGAVDVGEYLANSPECFYRVEETEPAKPVLKLGVLVAPAARITARQQMNRGRAIMALVEALEMTGYAVELCASYLSAKQGKALRIDVCIKQAGEPWSAGTVAYALAHTAFTRRLGFRMAEAHPDKGWIATGSYGSGHSIKEYKPDDMDLYFGYLTDAKTVQTPQTALNSVMREAKQQRPELLKAA